jgi:hypothetical protein
VKLAVKLRRGGQIALFVMAPGFSPEAFMFHGVSGSPAASRALLSG